MSKKILCAAVIALSLTIINTVAMASTFYDGTFNNADWTLDIQIVGQGGTANAWQQATGGNGGPFRQIHTSVNTQAGSAVYAFNIMPSAVWNPATQGGFASVDYSEDSLLIYGGGDGQFATIALRQNDVLYYGPGWGTPDYSWVHYEISALPADAFHPVGDINSHPDFSSNGSPIQFGFLRANSTHGGEYTRDGGIDNWTVTINVPEPATGLALLLCGAIVVRRNRGKRH